MSIRDIVSLIAGMLVFVPAIIALIIWLFKYGTQMANDEKYKKDYLKRIYDILKKHDDDEITFDKVDK